MDSAQKKGLEPGIVVRAHPLAPNLVCKCAEYGII